MADAKEKTVANVAAAKKEVETADTAEKKRGRKSGSTNKEAAKAKKSPAKKTPARKEEENSEVVILQYYGEDVDVDKVVERIKDTFAGEGHRVSSIKKLQVYLKPEERAAYYVINDKQAGKVDLF